MYADPSQEYVATFSMDSEIYHFRFVTKFINEHTDGSQFKSDFCFYDTKGKYIDESRNIIIKSIKSMAKSDSITVYRKMFKLKFNNFKEIPEMIDKPLCIYHDKLNISINDFINYTELINVENANMEGFYYSDELNANDTTWIYKNTIVKLFDIEDYECCAQSFYTIKGSISNIKKEKTFKTLDSLTRNGFYKEYEIEKSKLYNEKIIMITHRYE
jgi:hypothetical protein